MGDSPLAGVYAGAVLSCAALVLLGYAHRVYFWRAHMIMSHSAQVIRPRRARSQVIKPGQARSEARAGAVMTCPDELRAHLAGRTWPISPGWSHLSRTWLVGPQWWHDALGPPMLAGTLLVALVGGTVALLLPAPPE